MSGARTKRSSLGHRLVKSSKRRTFLGCPPGTEPRPMFLDYKDISTLRKFMTSQGKLMSRKKTGLSAAAQRALAAAVKRARFMALLPYVAE